MKVSLPTKRERRSLGAKGFTIVELLIVIVIIGILAALVIVAYNGIQARATDATRINDMQNVKKAIEAYNADNGSYPPPVGQLSLLTSYLVPQYIKALPVDPKNSTADGKTYGYYYGRTYTPNRAANGFTSTGSPNDYILGMTLQTSSKSTYGGWGAPGTFNWIDGT